MKIAVTSRGKKLEDPLDPRFGRAVSFLVFDTETNDFQVVDNTPNLNAAQGAGIQVIVGPEETVQEALRKFQAGGLKTAENADGEVNLTREEGSNVIESVARKTARADSTYANAFQ